MRAGPGQGHGGSHGPRPGQSGLAGGEPQRLEGKYHQHSVGNVVFLESEWERELRVVAGQNYSVRCVASNMVPDGVFVWRLEDVTLINHRPLLILSDGDGWRAVSQEIVLTAGQEQRGKRLACYHLQLDHRGEVLATDFIDLRIEISDDPGTSPPPVNNLTVTGTEESFKQDNDESAFTIRVETSPPSTIQTEPPTSHRIKTTAAASSPSTIPSKSPSLTITSAATTTSASSIWSSLIPRMTTKSLVTSIKKEERNVLRRKYFAVPCLHVRNNVFTSWGYGKLFGAPEFLYVDNFAQCRDECGRREDCQAWNYSKFYGCNLKSAVINQVNYFGWISGRKSCF